MVVTFLIVLGLGCAVRISQQSQMKLELKVKEKTKELSARNSDMRLILDNAEEGFLTCTLDGRIGSEYSAIIEHWFEKPNHDTKIWDFLMKGESAKRLANFKGGWGQFIDDFLPFDVSAGQMPQIIQNNQLYFETSYIPIYDHKKNLASILLVVKNITAKVESDKKNRVQQELVAAFQALSKDRAGFLDYFADAENMLRILNNSGDSLAKASQFRLVHTLKGNSAQYGLDTLAEICHNLESKLQDSDESLTVSDIALLSNAWNELSDRLISIIGNRARKFIELDIAEYTQVLHRIKQGASHTEIAAQIERWRLEPAVKRLDRMAEQAKSLANRLNIDNISIITNDNGVRLEPEAFSEMWSSMIHVVRNSIDHGFGGQTTKNPTLLLTTRLVGESMELSVEDNGCGIDWDRVKEIAIKMSLPCSTMKDLEACLFADGLSTKSEVTTLSGRGVGMAAVKQAIFDCGGTIDVISSKGQGTQFRFVLPMGQRLFKSSTRIAS
jgi:two-component system chemotaxis sensor kinase CheA